MLAQCDPNDIEPNACCGKGDRECECGPSDTIPAPAPASSFPPYVVRFGYQETREIWAREFSVALAVARALSSLYRTRAHEFPRCTVSIYNDDRRDDDNSYGLTEEERAEWLEEEMGEVF